MRASHSHSPFVRNPAMLARPLAGIPLLHPAAAVMGWTEAQTAAIALERDTSNLAAAQAAYADACPQLGRVNRLKAFRAINARRAALGRARKALAASAAARAALSSLSPRKGLPLAA